MKKLIYISLTFILLSCTAVRTQLLDQETFLLTEISADPSYGLSEKNPVEVGGVDKSEGPRNERRYLNALAGPNGEKVTYYRAGCCCPIRSWYGYRGMALLDNYRVTWEGSNDTVSIYINMYDYGVLKAPVGFSIEK